MEKKTNTLKKALTGIILSVILILIDQVEEALAHIRQRVEQAKPAPAPRHATRAPAKRAKSAKTPAKRKAALVAEHAHW